MRIALNAWFMNRLTAGSGQYLEALAGAVSRIAKGHHLLLVGWGGATIASGSSDPESAGRSCELVQVATPFDRLDRNLAKLWFEQISFPRTCRRLHADVALVPYWGSPLWSPCPVAVTIHDLIPLLLPAYRGGLTQQIYTNLVRHTARKARVILTDSEASRRDIVARLDVPPQQVRAVHLAVDERFQPVTDPAELSRVREKYGLPDEPFLLYLGGFDVRKNLVRLIEAFARIDGTPVRGPSGVRLVVAGKLPEQDTPFMPDPRVVVRRFGLVGAVHFPGWVDEADKPALYSLARAALFVSEYEGFGLPVLEAQACGCPVLTAGNPEQSR